ncbi:MAG: DUF488 family protein [Alphaproteobacteria bacterium]
MRDIWTIGHSSHPIEHFIGLLAAAGITAVADVRSRPWSRRHPQFNREALAGSLADAGIAYVFLGRELGARSEDPAVWRNGRVDYDLLAGSPAFQADLDRVEKGAGAHRVALMCAEREPLDCHRTVLVARHLAARGLTVTHLLADGRRETHAETERRLLAQTGEAADLLGDDAAALARAYGQRGHALAWTGDGAEIRGKGRPRR